MSGPAPGGGQRRDRVYLGWQYALLRPDPGPPPRRPVPPEAEQVSPDWVAAQRREEGLLDRPYLVAIGAAGLLLGGARTRPGGGSGGGGGARAPGTVSR